MRKQLVDAVDLSGATRYYPTATGDRGMPVDLQALRIVIAMVCSGGVTATVEATLTDTDRDGGDKTETWVDITKICKSANTGTDGAASFIDKSDILLIPPTLKIARLRIKSITADATNAVKYVVGVD
jgi:cellobiose-specific phosphotransferase system component IIB